MILKFSEFCAFISAGTNIRVDAEKYIHSVPTKLEPEGRVVPLSVLCTKVKFTLVSGGKVFFLRKDSEQKILRDKYVF